MKDSAMKIIKQLEEELVAQGEDYRENWVIGEKEVIVPEKGFININKSLVWIGGE